MDVDVDVDMCVGCHVVIDIDTIAQETCIDFT